MKRVYLAGAIEKAQSTPWRKELGELFAKNDYIVYDPVKDNEAIFADAIMGHKDDGTIYTLDELKGGNIWQEEKAAMLCEQTRINDRYYIKNADTILFYYDHRVSHGTMTELEWACEWKKDILFVRNIARNAIHPWNYAPRLRAIKEGNLKEFKNFGALREYLIKERGFKE